MWAVVVGIDDYPGTRRDLEQAVADADEMLLALRGLGVQPERTLALRDGEATADGILAAADWLVANAGPHDTAVLFYAGHVRKLGPGVEGILAADLAIVADSLLAERLAGLGSRDAWLFIAACYGGGFTELLAPGRVLTAAADAESISYESRELARSYVVEYAIHQALVQRRTAPVVQEAVAYAWNQLAATFPDRQLTSFDHAGHPIVLQRGEPIPVEHDASPLAGMVPTGTDGPGEPPAPPTIIWYHPPPTAPPPSSPPATAPAPPPPTTEPRSGCQGLLAILCG